MGQRTQQTPKPGRTRPASERDAGTRKGERSDNGVAETPVRQGRYRAQSLAAESPANARLAALQERVGESLRTRGTTQAPTQRRAGGHPAVVQRVLAYDQPIRAAEVQGVKQLGGKLVFRLTGANGNKVIVKFETHGGAETTAEAASRNELIQSLTRGVIDHVPGMTHLRDADIQELGQLPDALGGDAQLLKRIVGDAQARLDYIFLKKENVGVGENLRDMIRKEAKASRKPVRRKGRQDLAALLPPSQLLLLDPGIARSMGRTATFDLLVGSNDRFVPDPGAVNLENLDFSDTGTELVNLDQFDPNAPIRADREWEGGAILREAAQMELYARNVYNELLDRTGVPPELFDAGVARAFLDGMVAAAATLKRRIGPLRHMVENPHVDASDHTRAIAGVLIDRLRAMA